jgi:hypothetical protein
MKINYNVFGWTKEAPDRVSLLYLFTYRWIIHFLYPYFKMV